jgi:hemerythrin
MPLIIWNENYSVGVKEIDQQHQQIIAVINRLYELVENKNFDDSTISDILKELVEYADYHFSTEEKYFREFDYDKTESHVEMHNDYRARVRGMKENYEAGKKSEVLVDLADFLNGWWTWHVNHTDKEYIECFHQHGLY